jgi:hypothetical protein
VSRAVEPILDRVSDLFSLVFGFFPSGLAAVAVILIRVECQKAADQDSENDYTAGRMFSRERRFVTTEKS